MKKLLSVLLIAALCISTCVCTSAAEDVYPESAHDYANNCEERWTYTYPAAAEALYVTFSEETYFEPGRSYTSVTADDPPEMRQAILENGWYSEEGDWLRIYDGNGTLYTWASADELSGKTICLAGNSFTLVLETDAQDTAYGFSIDRISSVLPDGFALLRYHMREQTKYNLVAAGEEIGLSGNYKMRQDGDQIIVGWKTADGGNAWYYQNIREQNGDSWSMSSRIDTGLTAGSGAVYDLYPICCKIGMTKDDVFSFLNTGSVFDEGYYFTRAHYRQLFNNWFATFAWTPLAPIAILFQAFFTLLWPTLDFAGSCCGFPIAAMLQHYGKIDLLSRQGVGSVSELEPDDELVSAINYYNVQAAVCHAVNHVGIKRGTPEYSAQLHALYETLEAGTPVYFELYPHTRHPMLSILTGKAASIFDGAHGILLTGAYTDPDGNHILIAWDNTSSAYPSGSCDIVYINADFTEIYDDDWKWNGDPLDGFSWNESVDQFASFPTEGLSNPFAWHVALFKNGLSSLRQIISLLSQTVRAR